MMENFATLVKDIGRKIRSTDAKNIWLLLDAMDSGFSIDNIIEMKDFFRFLLKEEPNHSIYILMAANSYELAKGERCLDVQRMEYTRFDNYDKYREFVLLTRKKRDNLARIEQEG